MKIMSALKAVPSDILSLTSVSRSDALCKLSKSSWQPEINSFKSFQNIFSWGNFSIQFRKGKRLSFSPQFPSVSVLADELKEFYTLLTAKEGGKNLCP